MHLKLSSPAVKQRRLFATSGTDVAISRKNSTAWRFHKGVGGGRYWTILWEATVIAGQPYTLWNIAGCEGRQAVIPVSVEDSAIASSGTWGAKGTDQASTAYVNAYRLSTVSGSSKTWFSPIATKLCVLAFRGTKGVLVKVTIDGDATRATKIGTAQQLVDAGTFPNTILVANGGTLNPTDRVIDTYANLLNDFGYKWLLADDLAATGHTLVVSHTGYSNPAAVSPQMGVSAFAHANGAVKLSDVTATTPATGLDQDDASVVRSGTWLGVTAQGTAFSGDYRKTNDYTTPGAMTFTTPTACTRDEAYLGINTAQSIARVAIDGDYTRATYLKTVQNLIDAGTLGTWCLVGAAAKTAADAAGTSGSKAIVASLGLTSNDVGRFITLAGMGAANSLLYTQIETVTDGSHFTVKTAVSTTASGKAATCVAGVLNTTDRVIDLYTSGTANFGTNFAMAGDLANTTHTLRVELTPYTNPAAALYQPTLSISGFVAGSTFAVGNPVPAFEKDLGGVTAWERDLQITIGATSQFVGGHGWEEHVSTAVTMDGTPVSLTTDQQLVAGQKLVVVRTTNLRHPAIDPTNLLGTSVTTYTLDNVGMWFDSPSNTWDPVGAIGATIVAGYEPMCSMKQGVATKGGAPGIADIALTAPYDNSGRLQKQTDTAYMWEAGGHWALQMQVLDVAATVNSWAHSGPGYLWFKKFSTGENKMYSTRVDAANTPEALVPGGTWRPQALWQMAYFADADAALSRAA